jgi:hypothetical protein
MIDLNDIPTNVTRLATAGFLEHMGPKELLNLSPANAVAFAENYGLGFEQYIAAIEWLGEYHVKHAESLRRYALERAHA